MLRSTRWCLPAPKALSPVIPTSPMSLRCRSGHRPTLFAWVAGRRSVGFVDAHGMMARIKWLALDFPVVVAGGLHRVHDVLRLAEAIGISPVPELVTPKGRLRPGIAPD